MTDQTMFQEHLNKLGLPVIATNGLILPKSVADDYEFQKAVKREVAKTRTRKKDKDLDNPVSALLNFQPWQTNIFSRYESYADQHGKEKRYGPNFLQLYQVRKQCSLISSCAVTQKTKITGIDSISHDKHQPGWRIAHKNHHDTDYRETPEDKKISKELEKLLLNPDIEGYRESTFSQFLAKTTDDLITFDRLGIEPRYNKYYNKVVGYCHVDGTTIKPLIEPVMLQIQKDYTIDDSIKKDARKKNKLIMETMKRLERESGTSLFMRDAKGNIIIDRIKGEPIVKRWVQVIDGQIVNSFSNNNLIIGISNPSGRINHWGYGDSLVAEAVEAIVAWMLAFKTNTNLQSEGIVDGFLGLIGDWDPEVLQQFKDELRQRLRGVDNVGSIPIIGVDDMGGSKADIKWIPTRPTNKDSLYDYWLSYITNLIVSGIFQMHPSEVGMKELGSGSALGEKSNEAELNVKSVGHLSICKFLKNQVFDPFIKLAGQVNYSSPDYRFFWVGIDEAHSYSEEVDLRTKRISSYLTINEARAEENLAKLEDNKVLKKNQMVDEYISVLANIPQSLIQPVSTFINNQMMMGGGGGGQEGEEQGGQQEQPEEGNDQDNEQPNQEDQDYPDNVKQIRDQFIEKNAQKSLQSRTTTIQITRN